MENIKMFFAFYVAFATFFFLIWAIIEIFHAVIQSIISHNPLLVVGLFIGIISLYGTRYYMKKPDGFEVYNY